jgi:capsular exopolysaccharide synthesis family protein
VPYRPGALPSTELRDPVPEWDTEEIHLRDYLDVILRRKWLIVNTLLLTFVTALIVTLSQPKLYRAEAIIQVAPQEQKVTKFEEIVSSDLRSREFYDTQVELIKGREMARRVIERLDLGSNPVVVETVFGNGEEGLLARFKGFIKDLILSFIPEEQRGEQVPAAVDEATLREHRLMDFVSRNLSVRPSRTSMLIQIAFISPDRGLSREMVNGMTDEFVKWNMERKLDASDLARTFLMKQIDRSKISLEKAEEELNRFAQQAGIVSLDSKQNGIYRQLEYLNDALAEAEADMIGKQALFKQAEKDGPAVLPDVMNSDMIGELKAEYARLQADYEKLSVTFQDEYPAVRALLGRMNSVAQRENEEERKIFQTMRNQYEASVEKMAVLEKRVEQQKQAAMELNERTTQYKIMAREVETNKQIYQSLLERSREIESMAGISSSNIHIVDPAGLPILPAKPNVLRNLLLAVVFGLFAGLGLAFFLEYFTDQIANPDEISDRFQIPILGIMPLMKPVSGDLDKAFVDDPHSIFAEALRTTRVSLQLSGAGSKSRSFVITSTSPSQGKTTMAANLAMTFAAVGERVVLVDADMRRPRVHKIFYPLANAEGRGLSSFLAGGSGHELIRRNGESNLRFIPAGPVPPNPVELLASSRFSGLVKELEKRYDRVIIDSPPMQGFADTLVVSRNVGGVVIVSSVGETTREALRHFKKNILNVNSTILGCIINKVDLKRRHGYNSYYNYGYYNYAGQADKKRSESVARIAA